MKVLIVIACVFALISQAQAAGGGSTATACAAGGEDSTYTETIDGATRTIGGSGCPNYEEVVINPNSAGHLDWSQTVPATPQLSGVDTSLGETGSVVGLTFNGIAIFTCYGGPDYGECTDWDTSAVNLEGDTFDWCGGHAAQNSDYHYHVPPQCLLTQLGDMTDGASPQIGWMYDGFPVYGPKAPNSGDTEVFWQQCGTTGADSTYCTDSCGGYAGTYNDDGFTYRYFITGKESDMKNNPTQPAFESAYFPHTPVCIKGCCPDGVTCHDSVPACGTSATDGTDSTYTAAVGKSYTDNKVPAFAVPDCLYFPSGWTGSCDSACSDDTECGATTTCSDGTMNGDETATDCGGTCDPCTDCSAISVSGATCTTCSDSTCTAFTCNSNMFDTNGEAADGCEAGCPAVTEGTCTACSDASTCTAVTCNADKYDANSNAADGCESDCVAVAGGTCTACSDATTCTAVTCDTNMFDTNSDALDGCEDGCPTVADATCTACSDASTCTALTCTTGFLDTNGDATDGCEAVEFDSSASSLALTSWTFLLMSFALVRRF